MSMQNWHQTGCRAHSATAASGVKTKTTTGTSWRARSTVAVNRQRAFRSLSESASAMTTVDQTKNLSASRLNSAERWI